MGYISRLPPRVSYARSCLFIVPNIFGFTLDTVERLSPSLSKGAAQSTNSSEHSERSPCAADLHPSTSLLPLLRSTVSRLACPDSHHLFVLAGSPITSALWVHFAAFPASILRPLMFVYCPEYYSSILALRAHNLGAADTNNIAIFSENGGIICIYAKIVVTLRAKCRI